MERQLGLEPSLTAWKAVVVPDAAAELGAPYDFAAATCRLVRTVVVLVPSDAQAGSILRTNRYSTTEGRRRRRIEKAARLEPPLVGAKRHTALLVG